MITNLMHYHYTSFVYCLVMFLIWPYQEWPNQQLTLQCLCEWWSQWRSQGGSQKANGALRNLDLLLEAFARQIEKLVSTNNFFWLQSWLKRLD